MFYRFISVSSSPVPYSQPNLPSESASLFRGSTVSTQQSMGPYSIEARRLFYADRTVLWIVIHAPYSELPIELNVLQNIAQMVTAIVYDTRDNSTVVDVYKNGKSLLTQYEDLYVLLRQMKKVDRHEFQKNLYRLLVTIELGKNRFHPAIDPLLRLELPTVVGNPVYELDYVDTIEVSSSDQSTHKSSHNIMCKIQGPLSISSRSILYSTLDMITNYLDVVEQTIRDKVKSEKIKQYLLSQYDISGAVYVVDGFSSFLIDKSDHVLSIRADISMYGGNTYSVSDTSKYWIELNFEGELTDVLNAVRKRLLEAELSKPGHPDKTNLYEALTILNKKSIDTLLNKKSIDTLLNKKSIDTFTRELTEKSSRPIRKDEKDFLAAYYPEPIFLTQNEKENLSLLSNLPSNHDLFSGGAIDTLEWMNGVMYFPFLTHFSSWFHYFYLDFCNHKMNVELSPVCLVRMSISEKEALCSYLTKVAIHNSISTIELVNESLTRTIDRVPSEHGLSESTLIVRLREELDVLHRPSVSPTSRTSEWVSLNTRESIAADSFLDLLKRHTHFEFISSDVSSIMTSPTLLHFKQTLISGFNRQYQQLAERSIVKAYSPFDTSASTRGMRLTMGANPGTIDVKTLIRGWQNEGHLTLDCNWIGVVNRYILLSGSFIAAPRKEDCEQGAPLHRIALPEGAQVMTASLTGQYLSQIQSATLIARGRGLHSIMATHPGYYVRSGLDDDTGGIDGYTLPIVNPINVSYALVTGYYKIALMGANLADGLPLMKSETVTDSDVFQNRKSMKFLFEVTINELIRNASQINPLIVLANQASCLYMMELLVNAVENNSEGGLNLEHVSIIFYDWTEHDLYGGPQGTTPETVDRVNMKSYIRQQIERNKSDYPILSILESSNPSDSCSEWLNTAINTYIAAFAFDASISFDVPTESMLPSVVSHPVSSGAGGDVPAAMPASLPTLFSTPTLPLNYLQLIDDLYGNTDNKLGILKAAFNAAHYQRSFIAPDLIYSIRDMASFPMKHRLQVQDQPGAYTLKDFKQAFGNCDFYDPSIIEFLNLGGTSIQGPSYLDCINGNPDFRFKIPLGATIVPACSDGLVYSQIQCAVLSMRNRTGLTVFGAESGYYPLRAHSEDTTENLYGFVHNFDTDEIMSTFNTQFDVLFGRSRAPLLGESECKFLELNYDESIVDIDELLRNRRTARSISLRKGRDMIMAATAEAPLVILGTTKGVVSTMHWLCESVELLDATQRVNALQHVYLVGYDWHVKLLLPGPDFVSRLLSYAFAFDNSIVVEGADY